MRSIFDESIAIGNFTLGAKLIIEGDKLHHLVNVVRVKINEEILLLNGRGQKIYTKVEAIEKKSLTLLTLKFEQDDLESHLINITALVGITKKETFEDLIRLSIEAGIKKLYPLITDYSKPDFMVNKRVYEIMKNSIEQSNNPWLLKLEDKCELKNLTAPFFEAYDAVFVFSEESETTQSINRSLKAGANVLIIVGAEGGFSKSEQVAFAAIPNVQIVGFPAPIMRTPTALAAATGYVFAKLKESL